MKKLAVVGIVVALFIVGSFFVASPLKAEEDSRLGKYMGDLKGARDDWRGVVVDVQKISGRVKGETKFGTDIYTFESDLRGNTFSALNDGTMSCEFQDGGLSCNRFHGKWNAPGILKKVDQK